MRLEGKVALISGGARGQGAAEARLFSQEGAKVVFGDVLDEQGKMVELGSPFARPSRRPRKKIGTALWRSTPRAYSWEPSTRSQP